jgi:hypothetical protein
VRREAPGPSGVFHSIHEGNTIGGGRGRTVLGHAGGDYLLWLRAASQDQSGRQACPAYAVTTAVVQVGWVTLLLAGTRRRALDLHYCTGQGGTGILRGSHATNHGAGSDLRGIDTTHERTQPRREQIAWGDVGARQEADLAELADWVEGLRAAAHTARAQGNSTLAEALDVTRFEVYEGYLDEELDHKQSQAAARRSR